MTTRIPQDVLEPDIIAALVPYRNRLTNAGFRINQRGYASVAADFAVYAQNTITACNDIPTLELASTGLVRNILWSVASGLTAGNVAVLMANNNNTAHIHLSAEL